MRAAVLAAALAAAIVAVACGGGNGASADAACTPMGVCGECMQPNNVGVGMACTTGGGECGHNMAPFLFCTSDYEADAPSYCTGPCGSDADCGDNAYCSGSGHGGRGCMPAVCGGMPSN
jgi:hypothetical protein